MQLIRKETLDRLYNYNLKQKHFNQSGRCHRCGTDVSITIERTSAGYGINGGVLYVQNTNQFLLECERCFKITELPNQLKDEG